MDSGDTIMAEASQMAEASDAAKRAPEAIAALTARAARLQGAYAAARRDWAERVGRPYLDDPDRRPPPGELDAGSDQDE